MLTAILDGKIIFFKVRIISKDYLFGKIIFMRDFVGTLTVS
jgi:hypothetical protein